MSNEKEKPLPEIRMEPRSASASRANVYEVDVRELLEILLARKKNILRITLIFIAIGLFVALGSSEEYRSDVKLYPEMQQSPNLGGLSTLARQFGVGATRQQQVEGIPAELYPGIIRSTLLKKQLLDHSIYVSGLDAEVTLFEYFDSIKKDSAVESFLNYTILLPVTIINWFQKWRQSGEQVAKRVYEPGKEARLIRLSRAQWEVIDELRDRISSGMDLETAVVTIDVKMPEPDMAADVADQVVQLLKQYVTAYKTEKAKRDVEFVQGRYNDAFTRFERAQEDLERFRDENRGNLSAMARTREQRLQSEYDLTFNLYTNMAERLEEARIKLHEDTPVVNVIDPASIPAEKSEPRRAFIMVLFTLMGLLLGSAKAYFFS